MLTAQEIERLYFKSLYTGCTKILDVFDNLKTDESLTAFRSEVRGRRFLIAKEIFSRFPFSLKLIDPKISNPKSFCETTLFSNFIDSLYFLTTRYSLPHPDGLGRGYENVSKFYFYLVFTSEFNSNIRESIRNEFSKHLLDQTYSSNDKFFRSFKNGIFWKSENPNRTYTLRLPDGFLIQNVSIKKINQVIKVGAFRNLESIEAMVPREKRRKKSEKQKTTTKPKKT